MIWIDQAETRLMVNEKISAGFDAAGILVRGGTYDHVIEHYRKAVAANALRLKSARRSGPCSRADGRMEAH